MNSQDTTLIEKLKLSYSESSMQSIRKWIKFGRVTVNGQVIKKPSAAITLEDEVVLNRKDKSDLPFEILYTDRDIIVVDKPPGWLSVASLDPTESHIHGVLKRHFKTDRILPLHRLDKEVAGPLIFVKNTKEFDLYKDLFASHNISREYHAIVYGRISPKAGTFDSFLKEGRGYKVVECSSYEGKRAITHYEVIDQNDELSWIKLRLHTGRKNQIRVHLSANGHPIAGDVKYGGDPIGSKAIALYGHSLEFIHPKTKKKLSFKTTPPFIFKRLLKHFS